MSELKPFDWKNTIHRPYAPCFQTSGEEHPWTTGEVVTALGIVTVYAQEGQNAFTRFDFAHRGVLYSKSIRRTFSRRYMVTLADRFTRDVQKAVK